MALGAPPELSVQLGTLPPPRVGSAVFFANLKSLFYGNTAECQRLLHDIPGVESYGGRLLPILNLLHEGQDNLLLVEKEPDPTLTAWFANELALSLPQTRVLTHEDYEHLDANHPLWPHLCDHPAARIDGFITTGHLQILAESLGKTVCCPAEGSHQGNNKALLHHHLENAGLPVFETHLIADAAGVASGLSRLAQAGYTSAALKSQIGASGIGLLHLSCDNSHRAPPPSYFFHEGPCMLQGWLDSSVEGVRNIRSPSIQWMLSDDLITFYDLTEQLLSSDHLHEGNIAPPPWRNADSQATCDEMIRQAAVAAQWLHQTGYRGTASVDFHVCDRHGNTEVRICEINARVTGATYPSLLARHFRQDGAWLMRNLAAHQPVESARVLDALDCAQLLFHPGQKRGVLPINFNTLDDGRLFKGQFLCIDESPAACAELLRRADELEPTQWTPSRD